MNYTSFCYVRDLLVSHNVQPILAVVPDNRDRALMVDRYRDGVWEELRQLQSEGWHIGQHGLHHLLLQNDAGLLKLSEVSEFAGLSYERQRLMISEGQALLQSHGLSSKTWIAPAHSFDENTCKALRDLGFTNISDGISLFPFMRFGLTWIPQQLWSFRKLPIGLATICVHLNHLGLQHLQTMQKFIQANKIISFREGLEMAQTLRLGAAAQAGRAAGDLAFKCVFYTRMRQHRKAKGRSA
ncbi:MAG: DUF2334 domain-containing protein [Candidatus Desulfofervidaceae bacterium]|nr:DUF2334 domain-containing protein [Candidatus Desulfofervidaceae bacterium]